MSVILLANCGGSPGTTTTAIGLSLQWPREILLIDADPHANQAVLAGYLKGQSANGIGLASFAEAARAGALTPDYLRSQSLPLPGARTKARFLPGFNNASLPHTFMPILPYLVHQIETISAFCDVLVDLGRLTAEFWPSQLIAIADQFLVTLRSNLANLASARIWLPELTETLNSLNQGLSPELLVIGQGKPYSAREISKQFALTLAGVIEWSPSDASVLSDGKAAGRSFSRRPFNRSLISACSALTKRCADRQAQIGSSLQVAQ